MANRYGKGYYSDWYEMIQSIELGSKRAFKKACQKICEEANERIRGGIYGTYQPIEYDRTFEMFDLDGYMTYEIDGLQCTFMIDGDEIETLDARNPEHHGLTSDSGNGYSGEKFLEELINPNHQDFLFNCRKWIEDKYKTYYREECRKRGLSLT